LASECGDQRGFENIGGKRIPFVRSPGGSDYCATFYGSEDGTDHAKRRIESIGGRPKTVFGTTLLVRHDRRGKSSWGFVSNGRHWISGSASNKLQGIIDTTDGDWLIAAVRHLRQFPDRLLDISTPDSPASIVLRFVGRDIAEGGRRKLEMLARVIEAQATLERDESIAAKIFEAARKCAERLNRIPLKKEVKQQFELEGGALLDAGGFSKELSKAGFAWLPVKL
jgi:hypothetical protein